jgi:hypothetical protein
MKQFIFLVLIALVYCSCKEDPKPAPVNPCDGKTTFKADFDICEYLIDFDSLYVTDTIANFEVWIKTVGTYDSTRITVGSDARVFTGSKFKLNLGNSEIGQTIPVTMIGYRKKVSGCFTGEKIADTLTKSFFVACPLGKDCANVFPTKVQYAFVGKFKGYNEDEPNKEFTVTIVNYGRPPLSSSLSWDIQIYNLPNGCGGTRDNLSCGDGTTTGQNLLSLGADSWGFRSFAGSVSVLPGWCCGNVIVWGYVSSSDRNIITIWHRNYDKTNPRKFVGKRI